MRQRCQAFFWLAICAANRERAEQGHGSISFVWIESHLSFDEAMAQGYPKLHWIANHSAHELASRAADSFALPNDQIITLEQQTWLALSVLCRQVELAIALAPVKHKHPNRADEEAIMPSKVSKDELVLKWARASLSA